MKKTIPDTTCAIMTRDSRMNSGGGIELNVRTILPFFDRVEVYDTGSIDGAREDLARLEFPNLFVYDIPWSGFASTRNNILKRIPTRRVFFLDDDELPNVERIDDIIGLIENNPLTNQYWFIFGQFLMWPKRPYLTSTDEVMGCRLFDVVGAMYESRNDICYENIVFESERTHLKSPMKIMHFLPSSNAREWKEKIWYDRRACMTESPYENAQRLGWKQFNQWRLQYPLPEGLDIDRYLNERGVDASRILPAEFVDCATQSVKT